MIRNASSARLWMKTLRSVSIGNRKKEQWSIMIMINGVSVSMGK